MQPKGFLSVFERSSFHPFLKKRKHSKQKDFLKKYFKMDYENYEYLTDTEDFDIKVDPNTFVGEGYTVESDHLANVEYLPADNVAEDLFTKMQHLQAKLEDLEEKIEQKYSSFERKQENNFRMVIAKLNWIQKMLDLDKQRPSVISPKMPPQTVTSPPPIPTEAHEISEIFESKPVPTVPKESPPPLKLKAGPRPVSIIQVQAKSNALKGIVNISKATKRIIPLEKTAASDYKKSCPSFDFVALPEPVKIVQMKSPSSGLDRKENPTAEKIESSVPPKTKAEMIPHQFDPARILKTKPLIKTMTDMKSFERYLLIASYRAEILRNIKRLGGTSMTTETMGVMRTLLSNVVQAHYTYQGQRKGKENFSMTMTWDLIRECMQARYPTATVDNIRKVVMDMLRNAPARIKLVEFKNVS